MRVEGLVARADLNGREGRSSASDAPLACSGRGRRPSLLPDARPWGLAERLETRLGAEKGVESVGARVGSS